MFWMSTDPLDVGLQLLLCLRQGPILFAAVHVKQSGVWRGGFLSLPFVSLPKSWIIGALCHIQLYVFWTVWGLILILWWQAQLTGKFLWNILLALLYRLIHILWTYLFTHEHVYASAIFLWVEGTNFSRKNFLNP